MTTTQQTKVTKDLAAKRLFIVREFDAPVADVWKAWTQSELLDKWWAPKPWKAVTKFMDFREGGHWSYKMVGPEGPDSWCRADFKTIVPGKSFVGVDYFTDANGKKNEEFPTMYWKNVFSPTANGTKVEVELTFDKEEDITKILEMGFEQGFTAAHGNLDELLEEQKQAVS